MDRDGQMWSSEPAPSSAAGLDDPCSYWNSTSHPSQVGECGHAMVMEANQTVADSPMKNVTEIYQTWAPVLIFFCALTFFVNVFIVVAARWMRRPLTPTMYFSLSLAAADAIASLTVGLGLVFHR